MKKSGIAVLIGRSNVGKSTLLNTIVGSKVAITTPKAQTTRIPIHGIITTEEGQLVFVDTPGIFHTHKEPLTNVLNASVEDSLKDVDVLVYIVDPTREMGNEEQAVLRLIRMCDKPKVLVINKIDETNKPYLENYLDLANEFESVIQVSAKNGTNVKSLISTLFNYCNEGEYLYPEGQMTNLSQDVWLAELIREKLFLRLRQEIPYSIHVEVDDIQERENGVLYIHARILTTDERYKRIIIGKGGRGIKEIGQSTRRELEQAMQTKIYLDLEVDVDPHWIKRLMI